MPRTHTMALAAALLLMTGVAAGAFGAHALRQIVSPDYLAIWQTAVLYQLVHGLGLLGLSSLAARIGSGLLQVAAALMLAGTLLFSGSLYAITLSQASWLGPLTPLGGASLIISWALVAIAVFKAR